MEELEQWQLITRNIDSETEVYKVFDPRLQQNMCVKRASFHSFEDATKGSNEANNQMRLKSPNVCQVHTYRLTQREQRFVLEIEMELLDCDGREAIRRRNGKSWSEKELLGMLTTLVGVLALGQRIGISHRDIKTANLLFDRDGQVKLADFGSSKNMEGQTLGPHTIQGTEGFLSPLLSKWYCKFLINQSSPPRLSHNVYKSDVYSLGVSLLCFAMLLSEPPRPLCTSLKSIPYARLSLILEQMTAHEESMRPDFLELEEMLRIQPEPGPMIPLDTMNIRPACAQCRGVVGTAEWQSALPAKVTANYSMHLSCLCSVGCLETYTHNYTRRAQPCLLNSAHSFAEDRTWQQSADVVGSLYAYLLLSVCSRACWDLFLGGLQSGELAICRSCSNAATVSESTPTLDCGCHFCSAECFRTFLKVATEDFHVKKQLTCPFDQTPISPDHVSFLLRKNWPRTAFDVYSWYCLNDLKQISLSKLPCGLHYCCVACLPLLEQCGWRCWLCEPSA